MLLAEIAVSCNERVAYPHKDQHLCSLSAMPHCVYLFSYLSCPFRLGKDKGGFLEALRHRPTDKLNFILIRGQQRTR